MLIFILLELASWLAHFFCQSGWTKVYFYCSLIKVFKRQFLLPCDNFEEHDLFPFLNTNFLKEA